MWGPLSALASGTCSAIIAKISAATSTPGIMTQHLRNAFSPPFSWATRPGSLTRTLFSMFSIPLPPFCCLAPNQRRSTADLHPAGSRTFMLVLPDLHPAVLPVGDVDLSVRQGDAVGKEELPVATAGLAYVADEVRSVAGDVVHLDGVG